MADLLRHLQRTAGNQAVVRMLQDDLPRVSVQCYPIPDVPTLEKAAGYSGGKTRKRTWEVLTKTLKSYKPTSTTTDIGSIEGIRSACDAAHQSFTNAKKRKKVGEDKAARVQTELKRLQADCDIQIARLRLEHSLAGHTLGWYGMIHLLDKLGPIELLAQATTDATGELGTWLAVTRQRIATERDHQWTAEVASFLSGAGYTRDRTFYAAHGKAYDYPLPHVDWKAHLGSRMEDSFALLKAVLPELERLGVQHKVDTNPAVFAGTNKFVTIYPPRVESQWPELIKALEDGPGLESIQPVPGELPVGKRGAIGMRHGQITALTVSLLEHQGFVVELTGRKDLDGYFPVAVKAAKAEAPPPGIETTPFPNSQLKMKDKMLWFVHAVTFKAVPAVLYDGAIRPDPRLDPNPYRVALPSGVTART